MTIPSSHQLSAHQRSVVIRLDQIILAFLRHWLLVFNLLFGIYIITPWLAPVLMQSGYERAGHFIYTIYGTQCHQLPQRSFFLFGPKLMYPLAEIQAAWIDTDNPAILRQFIGSPEMGWKVAWSDRMVSIYSSIFMAGLLFAWVRRWLKPLPGCVVPLLVLPLVIDGTTHLISDLAGLGNGFRDTNAWLAMLTGNALPAWFYAGDILMSFNSWMRLVSGVLFGIGVVWFGYPYLEQYMGESVVQLEVKVRRAESSSRGREGATR